MLDVFINLYIHGLQEKVISSSMISLTIRRHPMSIMSYLIAVKWLMITVKKLTYMGQAVAKRRRPREGPKKRRSLLNKMNNFFSFRIIQMASDFRLQTSDCRLHKAQVHSLWSFIPGILMLPRRRQLV